MLLGRDAGKLEALGPLHPGAERRVAPVADPASLDRALAGAGAVINCAGPFLGTATPLIEAALRAGVHYLDVTAEQAVAAATRSDEHTSELQSQMRTSYAVFCLKKKQHHTRIY